MNSQKVEAINRALRTTVAKNVTYRRNFGSRVHTAIHNVNYGPGKSITGLRYLGLSNHWRYTGSEGPGNYANEQCKQKTYKNLNSTKRQDAIKGMKCFNCTGLIKLRLLPEIRFLAARGPSRDLSKSAEKMGGGGGGGWGGVGPCNALQDYASADLFSECRSFVSL